MKRNGSDRRGEDARTAGAEHRDPEDVGARTADIGHRERWTLKW